MPLHLKRSIRPGRRLAPKRGRPGTLYRSRGYIYHVLGLCGACRIARILFCRGVFLQLDKKTAHGNPKLDEVGALIREGAFTFLRREYRVLGLFSIIVMAVIFLFFPQPVWAGAGVGKNLLMVFAYLCGTVLSALAGYVGISIATIANLKAGHGRAGIHPEIFYGGLPRRRSDGHGRHRHFSRGRGAHLYHLP